MVCAFSRPRAQRRLSHSTATGAYLALRKLHGFEDLSFDFLDNAEDRAKAINEVRRRWKSQEDSPFTDLLPRTPLTTERDPIEGLVQRLIKERDRTTIFLKE